MGFFEENVAKFYAAEIILALEHLHAHQVLFRDLKPENIMLQNGHVVLVDFGLSKEGVSLEHRSQSFCGSPAYLSPELICKKGSSNKSDIFAVGTVLYEFLTGFTPFYDPDEKQMFKKIVRQPLQQSKGISQTAFSLISSMLKKNPEERPTWDVIKAHPFFQEVNWDKLQKRQYETPNIELFEELEYCQTRANFIDYDYTTENSDTNFVYGFNINCGFKIKSR